MAAAAPLVLSDFPRWRCHGRDLGSSEQKERAYDKYLAKYNRLVYIKQKRSLAKSPRHRIYLLFHVLIAVLVTVTVFSFGDVNGVQSDIVICAHIRVADDI